MNSITQKDRGAPDAPYHTCVPVGAVCAGTSPHSASIPALIVTRDLHERRPPPPAHIHRLWAAGLEGPAGVHVCGARNLALGTDLQKPNLLLLPDHHGDRGTVTCPISAPPEVLSFPARQSKAAGPRVPYPILFPGPLRNTHERGDFAYL
jgi:hypothetical protein